MNKLCKATFGEYDSGLQHTDSAKGKYLDCVRSAFDACKTSFMTQAMIGGEAWAKPVPMPDGRLTWQIVGRDSIIILGRDASGILSPEDIQQLIKRPQMQGIGAVGNAGALFTCEKVFGYSQKNAEGWFKTLKKKYPLYKGESGKIEDALAQRIAFAEELRRDGAKYGLVFSR